MVHDRVAAWTSAGLRRPAPLRERTRRRVGEAFPQIRDEAGKRYREGVAPRHDHIIMRRIGRQPWGTKCFAKATLDAVSLDGTTDLLGHRQSDAALRKSASIVTSRHLEAEATAVDPATVPHPEKLRSRLQSGWRRATAAARLAAPSAFWARPARRLPSPSCDPGLQAESRLRPREPARRDDLAAADRRHACPEAVTALAHELAGLIGPLHCPAPSCRSGTVRARWRGTATLAVLDLAASFARPVETRRKPVVAFR